ncbi:hypothetical protein WJX73_010830 [Symbiochloris irregularis]|uniref:Protein DETOXIFICATION n=1 Tax=Symbiochloris irregularis TaxID=706552 RepID=A0AAW1PSJ9_9CHLO
MASVFLDPLMALTDTAIVGRLGTLQLGAVGLSNLIFFFSTVLFSFLLAVTTPRVASAKARGEHDEASIETAHALWLAAGLGLALCAVLWAAAPWLMLSVFNVGPEQAAQGIPHLRIRSLAAPATLILFVTNGAFRGITDTRTPLLAGFAQNSVNFALDFVLVLWLGWGVSGSATAVAVAFYVGAVAMGGMLVWRNALQPRHLLSPPPAGKCLSLVKQGMPLMACIGAVVVAIFTATNQATGLGPVPLAAHAVVRQITDFCMALMGSFSTVGQSLVAASLGKGDAAESRAVVQRLLQWGLGFGGLMSAGLLLGHAWVPGFFTQDAAVVDCASSALFVVGLTMLLAPVATTLEGTLMGSEQYPWLGGRTLASAAVAVGVLTLSSRCHWGLPGVWLGLVSLVACNGLLDGWRLLQKDSPVAPLSKVAPVEDLESVPSVESLEKAWRRDIVGGASKGDKIAAGVEPRD